MKDGLHQWGMKWEKVREVVQERFVQTHPCLHNPQLAAENMESTAIAEETFSQISAEECERRWSVIRKYLTNAQIAKTFPPWTDHEVIFFVEYLLSVALELVKHLHVYFHYYLTL